MIINIATKANVYGSIVAKLIGTKKIVCSVWGLGVNFADNVGLKRKFLKILILYLYRLGFKLSSKVWFTNEYDYNWFVSDGIVGHEKAFLTKNYVNTDVYSPNSVTKEQILNLRKELGLKEKDKVVVMVARMSWAKGVKEFVEAAAILRDKYPMVKFILVGPMDDGSSDSVPESYLRENEKYDNFIWTGFRKNVQAFYAVSDLAVLPSYYREGGFPRGLTEAMSMGKPIITTDSVHCRATVEDGKNGYHVPIKNSRALANAIEKIITDDDKRENFGRYSRVKALNEFDERKVVSQVVQEVL
jgi:N,N'-diacetylbacillosaminyl-diphospho-undecaprenol alpha-1,3-N-acetylgalactosaminyltransferase